MTRLVSLFSCFFVLCCTTTAQEKNPTGNLQVVSISPASLSGISKDSIFEVVVDYDLGALGSGSTFEVGPMFSDVRGAGSLFSVSTSDHRQLTGSAGRVILNFPIRDVLADPRLARPLELWIVVLERNAKRMRIAARAGPYKYSTITGSMQ